MHTTLRMYPPWIAWKATTSLCPEISASRASNSIWIEPANEVPIPLPSTENLKTNSFGFMGMSQCSPKSTTLRRQAATARATSRPRSGYARERLGKSLTCTILSWLKKNNAYATGRNHYDFRALLPIFRAPLATFETNACLTAPLLFRRRPCKANRIARHNSLSFSNRHKRIRLHAFHRLLRPTRPNNLKLHRCILPRLPQSKRHRQLALRQIARPTLHHPRHAQSTIRHQRNPRPNPIPIRFHSHQFHAQHIVLVCI